MVKTTKTHHKLHRSIIDRIMSWIGVSLAVTLLAATFGLAWAHNFIHTQVVEQLSAQKISFPEAGSSALTTLPSADQAAVTKYAGQQLTTGAQAKVFADNYIAVHLAKIGGGQTYAELSSQAQANPDDQALAGKVQTMFRGEMLRGALLNAYAFDTIGSVTYYAASVSGAMSVVLIILAGLGFCHARKVSD